MTTPLLRTACRTVIAAVCLSLPVTVLADRAAPDELPAAVPPEPSTCSTLRAAISMHDRDSGITSSPDPG